MGNKANKADDDTEKFHPPSYRDANPISRVTQWYLNPLFREGYKRRLESEDIPGVLPWDESGYLGPKLEREWRREEKKKHPHFALTLLRIHRPTILIYGGMFVFVEIIKMCQPLLINLLLDYFQGRGVSQTMAYVYGTLLALCGIVFALPAAAGYHMGWSVGMRARASAGALVYRKVMSMKMEALRKTPSGDILNHMATDVEKFSTAAIMIHYLWLAPLQFITVVTLLLLDFGVSFLAGIGVLVFIITVQQIISRVYGKLRLTIADRTDKRTHLMNEIIAGMRVIKMYCWENPYTEKVADIRRREIRSGIHGGLLESTSFMFSLLSTKLCAMVTIVTYVMTGHLLTPQKIFKLVAWLEILRHSVFFCLTGCMLMGSQAFYSAERIQNFLMSDDKDDKLVSIKRPGDDGIRFRDVTALWPTSQRSAPPQRNTKGAKGLTQLKSHLVNIHDLVSIPIGFSLKNLDIHIKPGELVACVGPVGSGKSSILVAIMDQMPIVSGSIFKEGAVAYSPQEAWIFSGTLRDNVLFGTPMERSRYEETLSVCALKTDIDQMPGGDLSLVGERGLSLSGGQKARVNLARAVYRDADYYLLDDPLSAVDAKVGNHLFHRCISQHLAGKTRLLVTHQLQYLKRVDRIIVLQKGTIMACGTYESLKDKVDFASVLAKEEKKEEANPELKQQLPTTSHNLNVGSSYRRSSRRSIRSRKVSAVSDGLTEVSLSSLGDDDLNIMGGDDAAELEQEERMKGAVGFGVYLEYWKAGKGPVLFTIFLLLMSSSKILYVLVDWWLARWATWYMLDYPILYNSSTVEEGFVPSESRRYLHIYVALVLGLLCIGLAEAGSFVLFTRVAARNLHDKMFAKVMRAPLEFFERNPVGRILNRFARDMIFMDEILPQTANIVILYMMLTVAMVVFVCFVNAWALLFTIPLLVIVVIVRQYGARTTRDVKRIESQSRSPVYSHVTASLQGMPVIRAFGMEDLMIKQFDRLQDTHTAGWFAFLSSYRWLGVRFDFITGVYLSATVFASLILSNQLNGTLVGLSLVYIFSMLGVLQFVVRMTAEVESYMTSVERILQYTGLDQEASAHSDVPLPPNWPSNGGIIFSHMSVVYFEDSPPALNDICLTIHGGEKVGVVGRTGAGKSSLIAALMRLVEPKGSIWMDNVDVTTIGLDDLRNKVSIIPQDPVLFAGTLRVNLDPFSEYNDEEIWKAIEEVQLKEKIEQLPSALYGDVAEGGTNFSVGQKQLVCLARALLRQNKILLIDEATANVDQRTDALIQHTIREKFVNCTVLTVAHRLNTVMDSDKVLVLDHGEVMQFDHPFTLLQTESGLFYEMVKQTGTSQAQRLRRIAQRKFEQSSSGQSVQENETITPQNGPSFTVPAKVMSKVSTSDGSSTNDAKGPNKDGLPVAPGVIVSSVEEGAEGGVNTDDASSSTPAITVPAADEFEPGNEEQPTRSHGVGEIPVIVISSVCEPDRELDNDREDEYL